MVSKYRGKDSHSQWHLRSLRACISTIVLKSFPFKGTLLRGPGIFPTHPPPLPLCSQTHMYTDRRLPAEKDAKNIFSSFSLAKTSRKSWRNVVLMRLLGEVRSIMNVNPRWWGGTRWDETSWPPRQFGNLEKRYWVPRPSHHHQTALLTHSQVWSLVLHERHPV